MLKKLPRTLVFTDNRKTSENFKANITVLFCIVKYRLYRQSAKGSSVQATGKTGKGGSVQANWNKGSRAVKRMYKQSTIKCSTYDLLKSFHKLFKGGVGRCLVPVMKSDRDEILIEALD